MIICTGVLTADVQIILPGTIGGRRVIFNQCTGSFTLAVLNGAGDAGGGVVVGQGFMTPVALTAGQAFYDAYGSTPPGTLLTTALNYVPPGFLLCYGQAISRTTYSQLWTAAQLGGGWTWGNGDGSTTFNLPDARGRLLAGADNMGGTPAGNLTGYVVGTTGGEQTHTLITAELAAHNHGVTDPGHVHGINDPSHNHSYVKNTGGSGAIGSGGIVQQTTATTGNSTTGITINSATTGITTNNNGSGTPHNNVQPTAGVNVMIRY